MAKRELTSMERAALANRGQVGDSPSALPAYRIVFKDGRIGRTRGNGDVVITARGAEHIADQVFRMAQKKLASKWFDVAVDLEEGKGWIEGGRFGEFTIEKLVAQT
jgi:hypothetical protein